MYLGLTTAIVVSPKMFISLIFLTAAYAYSRRYGFQPVISDMSCVTKRLNTGSPYRKISRMAAGDM